MAPVCCFFDVALNARVVSFKAIAGDRLPLRKVLQKIEYFLQVNYIHGTGVQKAQIALLVSTIGGVIASHATGSISQEITGLDL